MTTNESTIHQMCPKCKDNIPYFRIAKMKTDQKYKGNDFGVYFHCSCEYEGEMSFNEYFDLYQKLEPKVPYNTICKEHNEKITSYYQHYSGNDEDRYPMCPKCKAPSDARVVSALNGEEEQKNVSKFKALYQKIIDQMNYFTELKNKYTPKVKSVERLEAAYNKITKETEKLKKYFDIINDNYRTDCLMSYNLIIVNQSEAYSSFNFYKYLDYDKDPDNVINYFEKYGLFFIPENKRLVHKPRDTDDHERKYDKGCIILLDKRIATIGTNKKLRIYNPLNDFNLEYEFKYFPDEPLFLCQLQNSDIVVSFKKQLKIFSLIQNELKEKFSIENAHKELISKLISLRDNMFATSSYDLTIKIWKGDEPYSKDPIKTLEGHTDEIESLLYLEDMDQIVSAGKDLTVRVWNVKTFQCIKVIMGAKCVSSNGMIRIDKDRVMIAGKRKMCIVNIETGSFEDKIDITEFYDNVDAFVMLRDKKTILGSLMYGKLLKFNLESKTKEKIDLMHEGSPIEFLTIDDHMIFTISTDETNRVWIY